MLFLRRIGKDLRKKLIIYLNYQKIFLKNKIEDLNKKNIKLKIIGKKNFSSKLSRLILSAEKKTKK